MSNSCDPATIQSSDSPDTRTMVWYEALGQAPCTNDDGRAGWLWRHTSPPLSPDLWQPRLEGWVGRALFKWRGKGPEGATIN